MNFSEIETSTDSRRATILCEKAAAVEDRAKSCECCNANDRCVCCRALLDKAQECKLRARLITQNIAAAAKAQQDADAAIALQEQHAALIAEAKIDPTLITASAASLLEHLAEKPLQEAAEILSLVLTIP